MAAWEPTLLVVSSLSATFPQFPQPFPPKRFERSLTQRPNFFILCVLSGVFCSLLLGLSLVGEGWLEGNSSVPEQDRWNGTEERPEWGASPEKPSKPLRFDTKS